MKRTRLIKTITSLTLAASYLSSPCALAVDDLIWAGEDGGKKPLFKWGEDKVWLNSKGTKIAWVSGSNALFSNPDAYLYPRITKNPIEAGTITVSANNYWLGIKCKDNQTVSLTADALVLTGDCKTFSLTHSGTDTGETLKEAPVNITTMTVDSGGGVVLYLDQDAPLTVGTLNVAQSSGLILQKASRKQDSEAKEITTVERGKLVATEINASAALVIGEEVDVTLGGGSLVSTIENTGTLNLNGSYTVNGEGLNFSAGSEYNTGLDGKETTGGNYFTGAKHGNTTYLVSGNGSVNISSGAKVEYKGHTYDLSTTSFEDLATAREADYTTFYMTETASSLKLSDIVTASGNQLTKVELGNGILSVDTMVSTVNAMGGTLAFVSGGSVATVNANDDITVTGNPDITGKTYNIAAQKTIRFSDGVQVDGVSFVGEGGVDIKNTNAAGTPAIQYSLDNSNALLTADKITMTAGATGDVTVGNKVAAATVENQGAHTLTLGNGDSAVKKVFATSGNIIFHNMGESAISLEEMTIGEGKQVGFYKGLDAAAEATVSISQSLTAGTGATLLSNLVLETNSHLDLDGGQMYLGSELTLGTNIGLDQDTLDAIAKLENIGDVHKLFINYPETVITNSNDGDWARDHFDLSSITDADYKITVGENGAYVGLVKVSNVPEPTTGTLSLLALCALTARRRRKN